MTVLENISSVQGEDLISYRPGTQRHWIECLSHLDPKFGGLSTVVPELALRLTSDEGFRVDLASFSASDETQALANPLNLQRTHWPSGRAAWLCKPELRSHFRQAVDEADGLHIHGIWEAHSAIASRAARVAKKPYIVSAHGMLEPWALAQKSLKKRLYAGLIERANLNHATALHALTIAEAEDYRRFGCKRPIAVIPNAVQVPRAVDGSLFLERHPGLRGQRLVLFLGRLHHKKGLEPLIRAWAKVAAHRSDVTLVLAGPDDANYKARLEALITELRLPSQVSFVGMLDTQMKWSALASAECFVLPSYSEGFSVAVLEAMGMALPVIVSRQCHVPEVTEVQAGQEIEPDEPELSDALEAMLQADSATRRATGRRSAALVHQRFSWAVVSRQLAELYNWAVTGARPQTFELLEVRS